MPTQLEEMVRKLTNLVELINTTTAQYNIIKRHPRIVDMNLTETAQNPMIHTNTMLLKKLTANFLAMRSFYEDLEKCVKQEGGEADGS